MDQKYFFLVLIKYFFFVFFCYYLINLGFNINKLCQDTFSFFLEMQKTCLLIAAILEIISVCMTNFMNIC